MMEAEVDLLAANLIWLQTVLHSPHPFKVVLNSAGRDAEPLKERIR